MGICITKTSYYFNIKHEFNLKPFRCLNFEQLDIYFEIIILRYAYGCVFS